MASRRRKSCKVRKTVTVKAHKRCVRKHHRKHRKSHKRRSKKM